MTKSYYQSSMGRGIWQKSSQTHQKNVVQMPHPGYLMSHIDSFSTILLAFTVLHQEEAKLYRFHELPHY
jgi:hypothetical protein